MRHRSTGQNKRPKNAGRMNGDELKFLFAYAQNIFVLWRRRYTVQACLPISRRIPKPLSRRTSCSLRRRGIAGNQDSSSHPACKRDREACPRCQDSRLEEFPSFYLSLSLSLSLCLTRYSGNRARQNDAFHRSSLGARFENALRSVDGGSDQFVAIPWILEGMRREVVNVRASGDGPIETTLDIVSNCAFSYSFQPSSLLRSAETSSSSGKASLSGLVDFSLFASRTVPRTRYFFSASRMETT